MLRIDKEKKLIFMVFNTIKRDSKKMIKRKGRIQASLDEPLARKFLRELEPITKGIARRTTIQNGLGENYIIKNTKDGIVGNIYLGGQFSEKKQEWTVEKLTEELMKAYNELYPEEIIIDSKEAVEVE